MEAELMIGHFRYRDLPSAIVILFMICQSEVFVADTNSFPVKIIFAATENGDIAILLETLLGGLISTN